MPEKPESMRFIVRVGKRENSLNYKKQALYNTIGNLVYMMCLWLLSVVTVRICGFEEGGVFTIAMSVGNIFYFIAMYGMRSFQASDTAHQYSGRTYIRTRAVTVAASVFLCLGYLVLVRYDRHTSLAILLYVVYRGLEAGSDVFFGELQKQGHLEVCGISMSLKGVLGVAAFSLLLMKARNLNAALAGLIVIAVLFGVYDVRSYLRYKDVNEPISSGTVWALLKDGFMMLLTTVFPIIVTAIPRLALEESCGKEILGIYSSISTPTVLLTTIIPNMLCPFMTYYGKCYQNGQNRKLLKMMWISIFCTAVLGCAACVLAYFLGDFVLGLVFGADVLPYMYIFIPLIIATTVYAFSMCGNSVLITIRYPIWLTSFAFSALAVSLIITRPLVSRWGMMGTVWAFACPFAVQLICQIVFLTVKLRKDRVGEPEEQIHNTLA